MIKEEACLWLRACLWVCVCVFVCWVGRKQKGFLNTRAHPNQKPHLDGVPESLKGTCISIVMGIVGQLPGAPSRQTSRGWTCSEDSTVPAGSPGSRAVRTKPNNGACVRSRPVLSLCVSHWYAFDLAKAGSLEECQQLCPSAGLKLPGALINILYLGGVVTSVRRSRIDTEGIRRNLWNITKLRSYKLKVCEHGSYKCWHINVYWTCFPATGLKLNPELSGHEETA